MAAKYEIYKDTRGEFRFRLKAANGERILASEGYSSEFGCQNGIASVRTNCAIDSRYDRRQASNGQPYFVLKAANGEIIGRSETYNSNSAMEAGITSVKRDGTTTEIDDLTN